MDEVLLGSLIDKVDSQDRKIQELNEKIEQIAAYAEVLDQFKTTLGGLRTEVQKISIPEKDIRELTVRLATITESLKHPGEGKIVHYHIHNNVWITAALFLVICLVSAGWFTAHSTENFIKPVIPSTGI